MFRLKKKNGFSIVELITVVAILNILVLFSYPSYVEYVKDSHVSSLKSQMFNISTDMERIKSRYFTYQAAIDANGFFISSPELLRYPKLISEPERFVITIENITDSTYNIVATPTDVQGLEYGRIMISFDGSDISGYYDVDDDLSWSEKWY